MQVIDSLQKGKYMTWATNATAASFAKWGIHLVWRAEVLSRIVYVLHMHVHYVQQIHNKFKYLLS